jgi:hypothetical protein
MSSPDYRNLDNKITAEVEQIRLQLKAMFININKIESSVRTFAQCVFINCI